MDIIEDWVDRVMSCFYRDRDKDDPEKHINNHLILPPTPLDPAKVDKDFEVLVKELGLAEEKQMEMQNYSLEKKMSLLVSQHCLQIEDANKFIQFLRNLKNSFVIDSTALRLLQELVISLRTQNFSYLEDFLAQSGLELLTDLLSNCHLHYNLEEPALFFLYALRALLNSPNGRNAVLQNELVLLNIARAIDFRDFKCKIVAVEILSGLCFIPEEGHSQVLKALTKVTSLLGERTRFPNTLRTSILGLINAILRTGPAENCSIYRQHLRCELLLLGMSTALDVCRSGSSTHEISLSESTTSSQIDSGSSSPIDYESAVGMAEALNSKLKHSQALPHFISLLQHLFMVPCDDQHIPLWRLFDLILQHLTLQSTVNGMTDVQTPIQNNIDMNEILARLQNHCDYERIEKELEKTREQMETERTRCIELENRLADYSDVRISSGSRISLASSSPSDPCPSPPLINSSSNLPPICPPTCPPPPPPPMNISANHLKSKDEQKNIPTPSNNTKTCFAATSSHKDDDNETVYGTINRRPQANISVIDPRRYQNCTIMLSKLKLSHKEICQAIMTMDEKSKLPKDMIEQMLKFVPTKEEQTLINEAVQKNGNGEPTVLALADRYMFEVSKIKRFEQRLRCLHTIRTFRDRIDTIVPCIKGVVNATNALQSSKRFRQFLTIVLAAGNYLNSGKRNGNAYGFELNSLNKLTDVKYSTRQDRNLLHWIIQFIEKKYPDITKLKRDLSTVLEAARFSQSETAAEIRSLEESILLIRRELNILETPESVPEKEDKFEKVAKSFISSATTEFHNLEKQFKEMKLKFEECSKYFCFQSTTSPEEMFSVISKFLTTFTEYHHQLWNEIEEEEKAKRQTIARTFLAKKSTARRNTNHKERDFEQLISALQSGDIFKEELSRLRTSFRPKKTIK
ncbi:unnamed protein product [Caenorhabditis angaria]|uniref:FH2 domain-containing protein n=1 Tax=Caenorhabditis angaria TaxID=860376 RepID=A0A9P1ITN6_9PELO|nr:unnamed protein product [Caenorhabditis angaria]